LILLKLVDFGVGLKFMSEYEGVKLAKRLKDKELRDFGVVKE